MTSEPQPANEAVSAWEEPVVDVHVDDEDALIVDVAGYEGPLDLLLALARTQKVDISKISVLALADQYLGFIGEAQKLRLELAADYLVMAAWLTYLKSRLLLPREAVKGEEATAEELARRLSFRLMRLEAMREAAAQLMTRMRLGRDVFARGMPEGTKTIRETEFTAKIYDLLHAYADQRRRTIKVGHVVKVRPVWSIKDARLRLERLLGETPIGERMDGLRALPAGVVGRAREWPHGAGKLVRRHAGDGARRSRSSCARKARSNPFTCVRASPSRANPMRNGRELSSW